MHPIVGASNSTDKCWLLDLSNGNRLIWSTIMNHSNHYFQILELELTCHCHKRSNNIRYMRIIRLGSLLGHLFLGFESTVQSLQFGGWVIHGDLATTLMIFGLVTFVKVKPHPPSSIIKCAIHQALTLLIFVQEVGKLRCDMRLWGANQLVFWVFYNEKSIWQHFILHVTTLVTCHNHYWH